jgi:hypothetical protein
VDRLDVEVAALARDAFARFLLKTRQFRQEPKRGVAQVEHTD